MQVQPELPEVEKTITPFEYFNQMKKDRQKQREINDEKAGGIPAIDPTNPDFNSMRDEIADQEPYMMKVQDQSQQWKYEVPDVYYFDFDNYCALFVLFAELCLVFGLRLDPTEYCWF